MIFISFSAFVEEKETSEYKKARICLSRKKALKLASSKLELGFID